MGKRKVGSFNIYQPPQIQWLNLIAFQFSVNNRLRKGFQVCDWFFAAWRFKDHTHSFLLFHYPVKAP